MSFISDLFGGSETQQQQVSQPTDVTPEAFAELREPLVAALRSLFPGGAQEGGGAFALDPAQAGEFAADLGPFETGLLELLQSGLLGGEGPIGASRDLLTSTLQGDLLQNPFLTQMIEAEQRRSLDALTGVLDRTLPGTFTQAGQFIQPGEGSSAFERAAAIATTGTAAELADISSEVLFRSFDAERQRQQEAVGLAQQDVDLTIRGLQAASLPRLIEQFGIDQAVIQFQRGIEVVLQALAIAAGLPLSQVGQLSTMTGTSETRPNIVGTFFPGGLRAGGSAFGSPG